MTENEVEKKVAEMLEFVEDRRLDKGIRVKDFQHECCGFTYSSWYQAMERNSITLRNLVKMAHGIGYRLEFVKEEQK